MRKTCAWKRVGWLAAATLVLGACGDDDGDASHFDFPIDVDHLQGPPEAGEWIALEPGGATTCAFDTDYRFFVRGGDPEKLMIDFRGGGACWDELTCGFAQGGALFSLEAGTLEQFEASIQAGDIYSEESPFADWTIVHLPYCTGDIHWGNNVATYGGNELQHKGFVNASTALAWVYEHFDAPDDILVTGCSAGAYGAAAHSAYVREHYDEANVRVLADSGAGIITESFLEDSLPNWDAQGNLPPFVPGLDGPLTELSMPDVYIAIAETFPDMVMAQTATAFDDDQIFFYTAMGGDEEDWPVLFRESLETIDEAVPNFRYYVPPGSMHCAIPYPFFAEREVDGVRLEDWVVQLATGDTPPANVACEGQECCEDPICAMCETDPEMPGCGFCEGFPDDVPACAP
ncbi:MAG: pectin acetylesterase-family hydrolase [Myxococcota bacterium]